ncbi:hypothetical protein ACOMHN_023246 [Nucella lapillus]
MMAPKTFRFVYFLSLLTSIGVFAQAPDVGKILIGTQGNLSEPTEYFFSQNANADVQSTASIRFSAVVFSGADGSEVSKDDQVTVTCLSETGTQDGFSRATFDSVNLPAADPEGIVRATVSRAVVGRPAVVRCFGVSQGLQCPATTDQTTQQPEFCRGTSLSDPITVRMSPAPVVSVCQPVSQVPGFITTGTFQVALSEAVKGSNVTVSCLQVAPPSLADCQRPDVTCCQTPIGEITVSPSTVSLGQTTAMMSYTITSSGTVCVGVQCQASSLGPLPEGYSQYVAGTSLDSSSLGLLQTVTPVLYIEPQYLTTYNNSFQSLLYLDASVDVPFQCQASVVPTLQEALQKTVPANIDCTFISAPGSTSPAVPATTVPTTTPPQQPTTMDANAPTTTTVVPTPPVDPTSAWFAVDSSFTVTADRKFHAVRTQRELAVIAAVQEIVVTTCCSTVTNANSSYSGLTVATATVAQLQPRLNNTGGVTSGTAGEERFVVNPAYREVALCPCDLTYLTCDINCCCDTECTDADKETFSGCIPGRLGGRDPDPDLRSCDSDHFPKDDWFRVLCVEFESNALLGEFYFNTNKLTSATEVTNKLVAQKKSQVYTYREAESRFSDLAVVSGYTDGSNILTIYSQGGAGNLPLPRHASSGRCLDSTPVQFLRDSRSTCTRVLTPDTCADLTVFSAGVYMQASSVSSPACPKSFSVSSTGRSLQDETQRVNVLVNYLCASDTAAYVKAAASSFSSLVGSKVTRSFTSSLGNANCSDLCDTDAACLSYNQGLGDSISGATTTTLPSRCSGDNGFRVQPVPSYSVGTRVCSNVVLSVSYRFSWAGQSITGVTADVVLGSVTLGTGGEVSVSQKFEAVFSHDYSGPANQSDNYQSLTTPYQRSGKPGYDYGKPVATGCRTTNSTTGDFLPVDQSQIKQMAIWSPGIDGLCQNARRRLLTFGDDAQSSCVLRLAFNEINACDSLKKLVLNHLNVLMPASVIGRFGYNSPDISTMWVEILRENPLLAEEAVSTTPAPTTTGGPTNGTVATTPPPAPENVTFDPLSVRGGVCKNAVSGIHLEVLYAETGRSNGYPLLEVVGAAVR